MPDQAQDEQPIDICICGRLALKIHCPSCGCYTVLHQARKRERHCDANTGEMRNVEVFRCRRCAMLFNDDEWRVNCRAPHLKRSQPMVDPAASSEQAEKIKVNLKERPQVDQDYIKKMQKEWFGKELE